MRTIAHLDDTYKEQKKKKKKISFYVHTRHSLFLNRTAITSLEKWVQTVILLFIFAKRQIMRFTLRSRRGPHTPIAYDTIKSLRKEIDRRIHVIPRIQYEPYLDESIHKLMNEGPIPSHFYRLKAVNDFKKLELQINHQNNFFKRHPKENIRGYLINALSDNLTENGQHMIHEFCDLYEHARHDPSEFQDEEYEIYSKLLLKLIDAYV